jgi:hypothetical protein
VPELRRVRLPEDDRARVPEAFDEQRVRLGDVPFERFRAAGRGHAGDVLQVLHGHRDAGERPGVLARLDGALHVAGFLACLVGTERDEGVDLVVQGFDPVEVRLEDLDRRDVARADPPAQFSRRHRRKVGHGTPLSVCRYNVGVPPHRRVGRIGSGTRFCPRSAHDDR